MLNNKSFKLSFWPLVITLTTFVILCKLGFWQLERAAEKQQILQQQKQAQPLTEDGLLDKLQSGELKELNFKDVEFEVHLFAQQQWLLDNRIFQGQVGYELVVPARVAQTDLVIWVNLGWWPAESSRSILPTIAIPETLAIEGTIKSDEFGSFTLGESEDSVDYPKRVQALSTVVEYEHPQSVLPVVVFANSNTIEGHPRLYEPVVMPPEKHQAYALQWFLLAFFSLIVFLGASFRNKASELEKSTTPKAN